MKIIWAYSRSDFIRFHHDPLHTLRNTFKHVNQYTTLCVSVEKHLHVYVLPQFEKKNSSRPHQNHAIGITGVHIKETKNKETKITTKKKPGTN